MIRTKLAVPSTAAPLIDRPRLKALLRDSRRRPLCLVSAPAGSGKTALLGSWARDRRRKGPLAWVSLDAGDDDRGRFWSEVTAALGAASGPLASLAVPPSSRLDAFIASFVNTLSRLRRPVTLVLDDFHEISDPAVAADLELVLERAPGNFRLVIATRADPPLRLERLRMEGQLTEIRASDLAFTLEEARTLMAGAEVRLADEDVERLWRKTDGWIGGLRLAELSLRNGQDPHTFAELFAGEDAAVSSYLMSEVLSRQTPETLEFLLRTSVVSELNGELADALSGGSDGGATLRELVHRNALVSELDGRGWYRYQHLFAEVLRIEVARRIPGELPGLHDRAARWLVRNGHPVQALRHAIAAHSWDLAAEILAERWLGLALVGLGTAAEDLARQLPDNVVRADAGLALAVAGLALDRGDEDRADEYLLLAAERAAALPVERRKRFAVMSTATDLYRARLLGHVEEALTAARAVLDERWDGSVAQDVHALTLLNLGIAEFWNGDLRTAARHLERAIGLSVEIANDHVFVTAKGYSAAAHMFAGRLGRSAAVAHEAIELAEARGWAEMPQSAMAWSALSSVRYHWGDLDAAELALARAERAARSSDERPLRATMAYKRARLLAARGVPEDALDTLSSAGEIMGGRPLPPLFRVAAAVLEARLRAALGEPEHARELIDGVNGSDASPATVVDARLQLADGHPAVARELVAPLLTGEPGTFAHLRVEAWVLDAISLDALSDPDGALHSLERALDVAEPHGYRQVIVEYGGPVRSLLRRRIAAGTSHRTLAGELLEALEDTQRGNGHVGSEALLEPLSDKELTVLRYLPTMMANAEIAAEMFVSVNTVKTHLKHVYRKLDVTDRREAVKRARELRLLGPNSRGS